MGKQTIKLTIHRQWNQQEHSICHNQFWIPMPHMCLLYLAIHNITHRPTTPQVVQLSNIRITYVSNPTKHSLSSTFQYMLPIWLLLSGPIPSHAASYLDCWSKLPTVLPIFLFSSSLQHSLPISWDANFCKFCFLSHS